MKIFYVFSSKKNSIIKKRGKGQVSNISSTWKIKNRSFKLYFYRLYFLILLPTKFELRLNLDSTLLKTLNIIKLIK